MHVSVWNTFVQMPDQSIRHFNIYVPVAINDTSLIYRYGEDYLHEYLDTFTRLSRDECRYGSIEIASEEIIRAIETKGYYIHDFGNISKQLPVNGK